MKGIGLNRLSRKRIYIAVDIGSYAIKAAVLVRKQQGLKICRVNRRELPRQSSTQDQLAEIVKDLLQGLKCPPGRLITTVPGSQLVIRNLSLPPMPDDEISEAVTWAAADNLPFPVEEVQTAYLIQNRDEEKIEILLAAVQQEVLHRILLSFKKLKLRPEVVNIQPLAFLSLLDYQYSQVGLPGSNRNDVVGILDVGAAASRLTIGSFNRVYLFRNIDIGGRAMTRLIMEKNGCNFQRAEELKKEGRVEACQPFLKQLAEEIKRSLDYCSSRCPGGDIKTLFLTGGASRLQGLSDTICSIVNLPVSLLDPFQGLTVNQSINTKGTEYAAVVGLCLSEVSAS